MLLWNIAQITNKTEEPELQIRNSELLLLMTVVFAADNQHKIWMPVHLQMLSTTFCETAKISSLNNLYTSAQHVLFTFIVFAAF